jgi:hypothetical protein
MLCLRIWILGPSETQNLGRQGLTKPYEDHFSHIFSQRERGILIHHLTQGWTFRTWTKAGGITNPIN